MLRIFPCSPKFLIFQLCSDFLWVASKNPHEEKSKTSLNRHTFCAIFLPVNRAFFNNENKEIALRAFFLPFIGKKTLRFACLVALSLRSGRKTGIKQKISLRSFSQIKFPARFQLCSVKFCGLPQNLTPRGNRGKFYFV